MLGLSDEELVARAKRELPSDTRSYEVLVQRYMNRVYSIVYRVVCNKEEAEDVTQEVFVKVYNSLKKFEQQAAFSSWLYRIATNSALDALDKTKRRPQAATPVANQRNGSKEEETDLLSLQATTEAGPEDSAIQSELRECISRVLKKLDKDQARVLVMRDFDDLSYDEIAKVMGANLSAVKMRIHRARLAFQDVFGQFCGAVYLSVSGSKTKTKESKVS
jgi:RNA polymerase sigma-70 factor (ECF subfamily)